MRISARAGLVFSILMIVISIVGVIFLLFPPNISKPVATLPSSPTVTAEIETYYCPNCHQCISGYTTVCEKCGANLYDADGQRKQSCPY